MGLLALGAAAPARSSGAGGDAGAGLGGAPAARRWPLAASTVTLCSVTPSTWSSVTPGRRLGAASRTHPQAASRCCLGAASHRLPRLVRDALAHDSQQQMVHEVLGI